MKINPALDAAALHDAYAQAGRITVPDFLDGDAARALVAAIEAEPHRNLVFFASGRHFDIDAAGWRDLDALKKQKTEAVIHAEARKGFSYFYENLPIYDRWRGGRELSQTLKDVVAFINGETFLGFMRTMTGFADIGFADAQATLYGPGHFLTVHNDAVEGKNRRAAFVINLTPEWREDWGGYLNFFDDKGDAVEGLMPAFNAVRVFSVPARHSVGFVSPFAGRARISITGWLRAGKDETPVS